MVRVAVRHHDRRAGQGLRPQHVREGDVEVPPHVLLFAAVHEDHLALRCLD
jgi:hypothetical protein